MCANTIQEALNILGLKSPGNRRNLRYRMSTGKSKPGKSAGKRDPIKRKDLRLDQCFCYVYSGSEKFHPEEGKQTEGKRIATCGGFKTKRI